MKITFRRLQVLFGFTRFTALALAIFLGGCTYLYANKSELESSKLLNIQLHELTEFAWTRPHKAKQYTGPQKTREMMKALDDAYNEVHAKTEVSIHKVEGTQTSSYTSNLTANEINARYPRAEWLEMLLNRGIIIDNLHKYASFLSKRRTLALLEDNPNLRQLGLLDIPPTDGWEGYKEAYMNKLVKDHVKTRDAAEQIERSKAKIKGTKTVYKQGIKKVLNTQGLEKIYLEFKYIREGL